MYWVLDTQNSDFDHLLQDFDLEASKGSIFYTGGSYGCVRLSRVPREEKREKHHPKCDFWHVILPRGPPQNPDLRNCHRGTPRLTWCDNVTVVCVKKHVPSASQYIPQTICSWRLCSLQGAKALKPGISTAHSHMSPRRGSMAGRWLGTWVWSGQRRVCPGLKHGVQSCVCRMQGTCIVCCMERGHIFFP